MTAKSSLKKATLRNVLIIIVTALVGYAIFLTVRIQTLSESEKHIAQKFEETKKTLDKNVKELTVLKNRNEYQINLTQQDEIKNIQNTYNSAFLTYEELVKLKELKVNIPALDQEFVKALAQLSKRDYKGAEATLSPLRSKITEERNKVAASFTIPANVPKDNSPPSSGPKKQSVVTEFGTFLVDIIAADLNSTRVVVDTASESTCKNDCPVASLATYASRSGAFAGINGPYFCPAAYPSCADKKNSFDTLLMNKNKTYFNSENNVYSTVPAVIFSGTSVRYVGASLEWGRDTGVDAVIANPPLIVVSGNVVFGGDEEAKRSSAGARSFIGNSGSTVYIGVVYNASVAQAARVIKALGIQNAINLDNGGSTALWSDGRYIAGPGRDTPFGVLFVRK